MLDDRDQRALDATAALLGRDDPELAACLRDHRLPPAKARGRTVQHPRARPRRGRVPFAVWPPVIMFLICLLLVVVPALIIETRVRPAGGADGASGAPTSQPVPATPTAGDR